MQVQIDVFQIACVEKGLSQDSGLMGQVIIFVTFLRQNVGSLMIVLGQQLFNFFFVDEFGSFEF